MVDGVDVSQGCIGPTLNRLEPHGLVDHRGRFWKIADAEHAVTSGAHLSAATADARDRGFSDEDVEAWMETAVDPIEEPDSGSEDA